jgi:regulatory protein
MDRKKPDKGEALIKARTFCNYRDRCHQEVRDKLYKMGLWKREVEEVMMQLMDEDPLNEERYARSFVRGYFSTKQWGKRKITYALRQKQIHDRLIQMAMSEIYEEDYTKTIDRLIEKKMGLLKDGTALERRTKVMNYLVQKGYDYSDVKARLDHKLGKSR